jgi:hypothetical protein
MPQSAGLPKLLKVAPILVTQRVDHRKKWFLPLAIGLPAAVVGLAFAGFLVLVSASANNAHTTDPTDYLDHTMKYRGKEVCLRLQYRGLQNGGIPFKDIMCGEFLSDEPGKPPFVVVLRLPEDLRDKTPDVLPGHWVWVRFVSSGHTGYRRGPLRPEEQKEGQWPNQEFDRITAIWR